MPPRISQDMSIGERIAHWRNYRGLTQEVCAGLVGKSLSWWRKVEQGVRHVEKLSDLVLVAQVLGVRTLDDLTGELSFSLALDREREHPLLPGIRDAIRDANFPGLTPDGDIPDPTEVSNRVTDLVEAFHTSHRFISVVGEQLPDTLRDASRAHRFTEAVDRRREAARALSGAYVLASEWLRAVATYGLADTACDRALAAAHDADDPVAIAIASWQSAGVLKDLGRAEEALERCWQGAALLEPGLSEAPIDHLSVYGHLQLQTSLSAGHCVDEATALRAWDRGDEMSRRLGLDHVHPITRFGASNVGVFLVRTYTALGKSRQALAAGDRVDIRAAPSMTVRGFGLIDIARGYVASRDDVAALHVFELAERETPELVAHNVHVREALRVMMRRDRRTISEELHELARRVGIFA